MNIGIITFHNIRNYGAALQAYALQTVLTQDAAYISDLIAPIESGQADMVIGSRFIKKEGFQSSVLRRAGIVFLSGLIRMLCGVRVRDVTSGMRAANKKMIRFFADNYAQDYPEPEAIITSGLARAKVVEVPVQMRERQGGVSTINPIKSIYYMIKVSLAHTALLEKRIQEMECKLQ